MQILQKLWLLMAYLRSMETGVADDPVAIQSSRPLQLSLDGVKPPLYQKIKLPPMILPNDPFEFVVPASHAIRTPGWEIAFGKYSWFYVVGARRLMTKAGIYNYSTVRSMASKVEVPVSWQKAYPAFEWNPLSENQVGRLIDQKLMCFDRACLSILALLAAIEKLGSQTFSTSASNVGAEKWIKIKPAMHEIDETPPLDVPDEHVRPALAAGFQRNKRFLEEIKEGRGATHGTLSGVAGYLHRENLHSTDTIGVKLRRTGGLKLTPASAEIVAEFYNSTTDEVT